MPTVLNTLLKLPRKLLALGIIAALMMLAGLILSPEKASTVVTGLAGAYAAFVTGHTTSDVMASKSAKAKTIPEEDEGS